MHTHRWLRRLGAVVLVAAPLGSGALWAHTVPLSTPPGIILVDVSKAVATAAPQFLWRRLGDAHGNPLYTSDADQPGKSSCYGDCAKEFPPYVASRGARAEGDWSIVPRDDHVKQWAYQGKPLYRYSGTDPLGEPESNNFQLKEDPAWHDPGSKVFSPKEGWRRAAYTPEKTAVMPTSVVLASIPVATGVGFVAPTTHTTLYLAPLSHKLTPDWHPLHAAALAVPVGAFSVVIRKDDGTHQWAYYGEALYTYAGDNLPGEVNGIRAGDKTVHPALAYRDFTPGGIELGQYPGAGPLMTASKGKTLYTVSRYHAAYGGRESIGGYTVTYNELKSQGTVGCEGDCTDTWKPFLAPSHAEGSGFWEVMTRPNGSKQWAYKGSPVYTYTGDSRPGDMEGNNRYVIAFGGPKGEMAYADAGARPRDRQPPRLGSLSMAAAVGMKPGEKAEYVAGQGHVPARPEVARFTNASNGKASTNVATAQDAGLGNGNSIRFPDHGAGFYWHAVQVGFQ